MRLFDCIHLLEDTYTSIDIRVAVYKKNDEWHNAIIIIRFRKEDVEEISKNHKELIKKYGEIKEELFRVDLFSLPISKWSEMYANWRQGFIGINDDFIIKITGGGFLNYETREPYEHNGFNRIDEQWRSYHYSFQDSDPQVNQIVSKYNKKALENRSRDIFEYLARIFEIGHAHTETLPRYIIVAPVFFKVENIEFKDSSICIDCFGYPKDDIDFTIDFSKGYGNMPRISKDLKRIKYTIEGELGKPQKFSITEKIDSMHKDDYFRLDVFRKNGILLSSLENKVGNYWPTKSKITNPKYEVFKNFVNIDELKDMIINLKSKDMRAPDKIFERGVTWILNLIGISAIRLEGYERAGEDPEQISIDIIGSLGEKQIVLANATLSIPDNSMLETERNRKIILSRNLNDEVNVTSVIFTPKSVTQLKVDADKHEVVIIGKEEIETILELLKNGDIIEAQNMILRSKDFSTFTGL